MFVKKNSNKSFSINTRDKKTAARTGILRTVHGIILTPAYVTVATHGKVRTLSGTDIKKTQTQVVIANAYHLWDPAQKRKSFLLKLLGTKLPTMTDSGGFQLFSFGAAREHNVGKVLQRKRRLPGEKSAVKITEEGVSFILDNDPRLLTPELSINIQKRIGADIIFALDECTSPLHSYAHNKRALERTTRWAKRCLKVFNSNSSQLLFGIVQGGRFNTLRKQSAKAISSLPFDGFGIGGSFGEKEMAGSLKVVIPYLPEEKPRHLLGIGKIKDIFTAVENGIDLLDCVIPTREARHGRIWTANGAYDVRKSIYSYRHSRLEKSCKCPACTAGITKAKLRTLFKQHDPKAGRYATLHNVWFFNNLMEQIRKSLERGNFAAFKKKFLVNFTNTPR